MRCDSALAALLGFHLINRFWDGVRVCNGGVVPSCTVTAQSITVFREVDAALREIAQFLHALADADVKMYGDEGENRGMQIAFALMN